MIARSSHSLKLVLLLVLLVAGWVLLLSRPAAQTNSGMAVESVLRDARTIADSLNAPTFVIGDETVDGDAIIRFYRLRDSRMAWSGDFQTADAAIATHALSTAKDHGLDTAGYHLRQLAERNWAESADGMATHDLLLTDAILKYARDIWSGSVAPNAVDRDINLRAEPIDAVPSLNAALDGGTFDDFLADLAPPHPEYRRLTVALAHYRKLADEGGWPRIPSSTQSGRAELETYVRLLRERLAREDAMVDREPDLTEALRRYQRRNGLEPDGKFGPRTLSALNVPAPDRVKQIVANMERWRWLPRQLEHPRIMVNAADATLEFIDDGQVILRSKVIVGTPDRRTPMFSTLATGVTVNPPWNVPSSIARNEILPRLRRNPNYLLSQNMIVLDGPPDDPHGTRIDWTRIPKGTFPYRLQQRPGENNALGKLKLEMPNAFSVYLHDTPGRQAFSRTERTLSHGCIRVEEILPLASVALGGDVTAAIQTLTGAGVTDETKYFALEQPLPVYILYWTAMADPDGTVQFRRDIYGRDERLAQAIRTGSADKLAFFTGDCGHQSG